MYALASLFILFAITSVANPLGLLYTHERGKKTVNLAAAAYSTDPLPCLQQSYPKANYRILNYVEVPCDRRNNTCAMYIAISTVEKTIVVGFRGTTTNDQLVLESLESLVHQSNWYGVGDVNKYFYEALDPLWMPLEAVLTQKSSKNYQVLFTGHSLGGALATMAAMKTHVTRLRDNEQISLLTYGEPRVGNRVFAQNVIASIRDSWRVVHKADMVPHLPPCKNKGKGCDEMDLRRHFHHGFEIWYPGDMSGRPHFQACTKNTEDEGCSNSLGPRYKWEDHRWYYGVYVSTHGREGCTNAFPSTAEDYKKKTSSSILSFPLVLLSLIMFII